jgi:hypothetical protein
MEQQGVAQGVDDGAKGSRSLVDIDVDGELLFRVHFPLNNVTKQSVDFLLQDFQLFARVVQVDLEVAQVAVHGSGLLGPDACYGEIKRHCYTSQVSRVS